MLRFTHYFAGQSHTVTVWEPGHPVLKCTGPICGVDSETTLIKNKYTWPDLVVAGFSCNREVHIVPWQYVTQYQEELFKVNPTTKFSFFNLAFDFNVMGKEQWLELLKQEGRILELSVASKMHYAGVRGWIPGKVTLASITKDFIGEELNKEDGTRTSFSRDTPLTEQQIRYLAEDCISTELCALCVNNLPTETLQARASFVLSEIGFNGMLIDRKHFDRIRSKLQQLMSEDLVKLRKFGYRVKQYTEEMTQLQRLEAICKAFGVPGIGKALENSGRSTPPAPAIWILAANVLSLCGSGDIVLPSELREVVSNTVAPICSPDVDWSSKNKLVTQFKEAAIASIKAYLETIDCADCVSGKSPKAEVALVILEVILQAIATNSTDVKGFFDTEFEMRYEENLGWLSGTKPKKNTELIQNHLKGLMAANPGLQFGLTDTSAKNTRKYATACSRKNEEPDQAELAKLAVYACKRSEMWRMTDLGVNDPFLETYTAYKHREKLLQTYFNPDTIDGDGRWHTRFNAFLVTGRTSSSNPNIQNIAKEQGVRENVIAPPGKVLCACDYSQEELITLAATLQHRYGKSRMADAINAGLCLHSLFAAYRDHKLDGIPMDHLTDPDVVAKIKPILKPYKEDKELKKHRQLAKSY